MPRPRSMWICRTLIGVLAAFVIGGCGGEKWPLAESPPSTAATTPPTTGPAPGRGNITPTSSDSVGGLTEQDAEAGNQALFDGDRTQLEATLRAQPDPKFTSLSYNAYNNVVIVTFAYRKPSAAARSRADDFAWQTSQALSDSFWFPELVATFPSHHADPAWLPKLRIQLDDVTYICPAVVQIAVAAHHITQHEWLVRCAA